MAHIFKPPVQRGIKEMQMSVLLYSSTCQYRANCSQKWENRNSDRPRHNDFQGLITAEHLTDISSSFKKRFSDEKLSLIRKRSLYMETFSEVSNILPKISICSGWLVIFTPKKKKSQIGLREVSDLVPGNQCPSSGFLKGPTNRSTQRTYTYYRGLEFLSVSSLVLFL